MNETTYIKPVNSERDKSTAIQTTYKDSPLGRIPGDWEVTELGKISKVTSGGTPSRANKSYWGGTIPWITTSLIDFNEIESAEQFISDEGLRNSSAKLFSPGTLLMALYGQGITRGKVAILKTEATINQACAAILLDDKRADVQFIFQYLVSKYADIRNLSNTGSQENLNGVLVKSIRLRLPPLYEQKAIACILTLMDTVIKTNNALLAKKEVQKKWLMQNLLTGKKRLKGFRGEWKKLGAGEIFKSATVKGFENEELLSATQDRGIIPRTMLEGRVTMPEGTTAGYKLVEPGDFVISLRSFQGGLEYSYYRGIVSPAYIVLKPKKRINKEFYKQYYKSYEFIGRLATAVIGIRDGKQVSYNDYCLVKIPYPSLEEQTAIAQVLQAADKEIELLKTKTEKLREQKKGMMQVLLTGKKRLKI